MTKFDFVRVSLLPMMIISVTFVVLGCDRGNPAPTAAVKPVTTDAVATDEPVRLCLVSGEVMGSMGKPVTYEHEGKTLEFCCDHCIDEFKKDPAKYLAKLDAVDAAKKIATDAVPHDHTDHTGHTH